MGLLCNLFGGPGVAKTTTALGVAYFLKRARISAEYVDEVAKQYIWRDEAEVLKENQALVGGEQLLNLTRVLEHVDVVVTDGPFLFSCIYKSASCPPTFDDYWLAKHRSMNTLNFYLTRTIPYDAVGRYQDENGAREVDARISAWMDRNNIDYTAIPGGDGSVERILADIRERIGK